MRPVDPEGRRVEQAKSVDSEPPRTASAEVARVLCASSDAGYVVVEVVGDIDLLSRYVLAEALVAAGRYAVPAVIVDLSAVTLLSAAGFHCLQDAAEPLAARGGQLHLVCPPGCVSDRILRIFDPHGAWSRHADLGTAVASTIGGLRPGLPRSRSCPGPARP